MPDNIVPAAYEIPPSQRQSIVTPPPGWIPADSFNGNSAPITVPAGQGFTAALATGLLAVSAAIPPAARVLTQAVSLQVTSGPVSQLLFSLVVTGMPVPGFSQTNAQALAQLGLIPVNRIFDPPGPVRIDLFNVSGTTQTGAGAAVDVVAVVSWIGLLLVNANRSQNQWGG